MKSIWFIGGFALGLLCISLVHAALPSRVTDPASQLVTELHAPKVTAPDLEADFNRLEKSESRYAENWDQQKKLLAATHAKALAAAPATRSSPKKTKKLNSKKRPASGAVQ